MRWVDKFFRDVERRKLLKLVNVSRSYTKNWLAFWRYNVTTSTQTYRAVVAAVVQIDSVDSRCVLRMGHNKTQ